MENLASWVATIATIAAACLTASNLGARITGYGFIVFTIGSIAWLALGLLTGQPALVWTNVVMTGLNLFGVWRWLGRQASVEDGAGRAAEKSSAMASETLFPASLLTHARLAVAGGDEAGTLVDAMIGCRSGQVGYLVVGEGGVAGVGETFRRVDWSDVDVHREHIAAKLTRVQFDRLPTLERDDWPGR